MQSSESESEPLNNPPKPGRTLIHIRGMSCAGCASGIERSLLRLPNISLASVSFASATATVQFNLPSGPNSQDIDSVLGAIRSLGFGAAVAQTHDIEQPAPDPKVGKGGLELADTRLMIALVCTLPVFVIAMSHGTIPWLHGALSNWVQLVLTTPVLFFAGWPLIRGAWRSTRARTANMDTLVTLGTGAAYFFSAYSTVASSLLTHNPPHGSPSHAPVYFETTAVVILLILVGKRLESRATRRAADAIDRLVTLRPPRATIESDHGLREVDARSLNVGDLLVVRPGERVAADAIIVSGSSALDESLLTGESLPIDKAVGDTIHAGTLNTSGSLHARVSSPPGDAMLDRIIRLVQEAQSGKAPISRLADRVSAWLVPLVLLTSLLTFCCWYLVFPTENSLHFALSASVSVLVISCPCALGLATPTAIMAATGRAARRGILFSDAAMLEQAHKITLVAFDKTGTLTRGNPTVSSIYAAPGVDETELLRTAASLEQSSEHPIARAIVAEATRRGLSLATGIDTTITAGSGLKANLNGRTVLVGTMDFLSSHGADTSPLALAIECAAARAESIVAVAIADRPTGVIGISDAIRPEAAEAVDRLNAMGIRVVLLSGDHEHAVRAAAASVGITESHARLRPEDKAAFIKSYRSSGELVAMVGDGVNDAPALALADVGFAFCSGVDAAAEVADITIMHNDPRSVAETIALSARTLAIIRQNLCWAFGYNLVSIPLAAGLFYPVTGWLLSPMIAGLAMSLSSISVVLNSLRLR
ncbi:MAG: copper-translocating P-type ATPase [Phycisphaeraceae bacterium]|nr:copper-translocating P-type ATPase [Phycisphaeraceae bacterium]